MALSRPASAPTLQQTGLRRSPSQTQVVLIHSSKKYNVRPTSAAALRTTATMPSLLAHNPLRAKLPPPPRRIGAWQPPPPRRTATTASSPAWRMAERREKQEAMWQRHREWLQASRKALEQEEDWRRSTAAATMAALRERNDELRALLESAASNPGTGSRNSVSDALTRSQRRQGLACKIRVQVGR